MPSDIGKPKDVAAAVKACQKCKSLTGMGWCSRQDKAIEPDMRHLCYLAGWADWRPYESWHNGKVEPAPPCE